MKRFDDCWDRYIEGRADLVGVIGVWADANVSTSGFTPSVVVPPFGARTGQKCLQIRPTGSPADYGLRGVLRGASASEVFIAGGFYFPQLPNNSTRFSITLRDGSNGLVCEITFGSTGTIILRNSAGHNIAESSQPVIQAGEWKFLEIRVLVNSSTGQFEVRDDAGNILVNTSGLNNGSVNVASFSLRNVNNTNDGIYWYLDDLSVKDTSGSRMNDFYPVGGVRNFLLRPNADDPGTDWPFVARRIFDIGVGQILNDASGGWRTPDSATLEIGSSDYTVEGVFRWNALPAASAEQTLLAKWRASNNNRSWRLFLYENGGDYFLSLETSTDGTTGTLVVVHDYPFTPDLFRPYSIAVSRNSGDNALYIDGVRVGPVASDAATYYNSNDEMTVACEKTGTNNTINGFNGWVDEVRFTNGVGRYPSEYTPATSKFPRDNTDPDWNSVQLLMGFDGPVAIDESQFGRVINTNGTAETLITDDGLFSYQSINKPFRDDTFIEAAFLPATGTFELTGQPTASEAITIGSDTYTFVASLSSAYDVLIGVDEDETIANLIAAINQEAGSGTIYGVGTVANADALAIPQPGPIVKIEALVPGTTGNSIAFTTTVVGSIISGSGTLENGEDIPAPATHFLERLPRGITRVDSISLFTRRSVFGPGSATVEPSFIDGSSGASVGDDASAPGNPSWQVDQFDDNGGNPWSAADFVGARVRVNRTT